MSQEAIGQYDLAQDEDKIRQWFTHVKLEQAIDTHRAIIVIIETRMALEPKRKRRKDAGRTRSLNLESVNDSGDPEYPPA